MAWTSRCAKNLQLPTFHIWHHYGLHKCSNTNFEKVREFNKISSTRAEMFLSHEVN